MRGATGFAVLALAGALAGCGGTSATGSPDGAKVFAKSCAGCHSLIGNESRHRQGGDLLAYRMSRQELVEFTREMPVRRPLSAAGLTAVVDYVAAIQRRSAAR
jgi:mono/diheme cytochrome c family protein